MWRSICQKKKLANQGLKQHALTIVSYEGFALGTQDSQCNRCFDTKPTKLHRSKVLAGWYPSAHKAKEQALDQHSGSAASCSGAAREACCADIARIEAVNCDICQLLTPSTATSCNHKRHRHCVSTFVRVWPQCRCKQHSTKRVYCNFATPVEPPLGCRTPHNTIEHDVLQQPPK